MTALRVAYFLRRHPRVNGLINRGPVRRWLSAGVWAHLEASPGFNEGMARAQADFDVGRFYRFDTKTGLSIRNPDWPKGDSPSRSEYDILASRGALIEGEG